MFGLRPARQVRNAWCRLSYYLYTLYGTISQVLNVEAAVRRIHAEHEILLEVVSDAPVCLAEDEFVLLWSPRSESTIDVPLTVKVMGRLLTLVPLSASPLAVKAVCDGTVIDPFLVCQVVEDVEGIRLLPGGVPGLFFVTAMPHATLLCDARWSAAMDGGDAVLRFCAAISEASNDLQVCADAPAVGSELCSSDSIVRGDMSEQASATCGDGNPALSTHEAALTSLSHLRDAAATATPSSLSTTATPHTLTNVYIIHDAASCPVRASVPGSTLWQVVVREVYAVLCDLSDLEAAALDLSHLPTPQWCFLRQAFIHAVGSGRGSVQPNPEPQSLALAEMRLCRGFSCVDPGARGGGGGRNELPCECCDRRLLLPCSGTKDSDVDTDIRRRMSEILDRHCDSRQSLSQPPRVGVVLISGNPAFTPDVLRLMQRGFRVAVFFEDGAGAAEGDSCMTSSDTLLGGARHRNIWKSLLLRATLPETAPALMPPVTSCRDAALPLNWALTSGLTTGTRAPDVASVGDVAADPTLGKRQRHESASDERALVEQVGGGCGAFCLPPEPIVDPATVARPGTAALGGAQVWPFPQRSLLPRSVGASSLDAPPPARQAPHLLAVPQLRTGAGAPRGGNP